MNKYTTHTDTTAPEASKPLLQSAKRAFGFVPNLLAMQAESPALLEGYMTLTEIFGRTQLSETERQIILMTNNRLNDCTYCMAAHTTISQGAKVPADVIQALRDGSEIKDRKLEALRLFAIEKLGADRQAALSPDHAVYFAQVAAFANEDAPEHPSHPWQSNPSHPSESSSECRSNATVRDGITGG